MRMFKSSYILLLVQAILASLLFTSCTENEEESNEYDNWEARNIEYFNRIYNTASTSNDAKWKIIRKWSFEEGMATLPEHHIVVEVLQESQSPFATETPLFTDSAYVNYRGRLIPTEHNAEGLVFDETYSSKEYVEELAQPRLFCVGTGVVDGMATALMNMHIGDHWRVYIPYQLGYNTSVTGSIPAYSTLIFDLSLMAYYRAGTTVPTWK